MINRASNCQYNLQYEQILFYFNFFKIKYKFVFLKLQLKGSELWNKKLIEISTNGILRAKALIVKKQDEKVGQLKSRRREKEEIFFLNQSNLQTEEESKRVQNLKSIDKKARKVHVVNAPSLPHFSCKHTYSH